MDEVFGAENFVSQINFKTTGGAGSPSGGTVTLASVNNFILWYAKSSPVDKVPSGIPLKGANCPAAQLPTTSSTFSI